VAIQHDGDLSKIEDNTKLNSIIAHEDMMMNEKYKPSYTSRVNAFLLMGTNQPVKISDAKSGIIRRLIDVHPTGAKIPR
jgi:phage/plasmid-associated DNA primase